MSKEIHNNDKDRIKNLIGINKTLDQSSDLSNAVKCHNGIFIGKEENNIISYKGIPYAKAPVGSLRWKAPLEAEDSNTIYEAYYYGKSPIQTEWPSEVASYYLQGEDCLTLNIWSNSNITENKTSMVFFHGGSYGWGGTSDPIYDGTRFVEAHPEIILITAEYRTGIMGFMDFSKVTGGEDYKESGNLGLLDMVCALKWIQKNIAGFGGDPKQVTIFGESAGAGAVSLLPLMKGTEGLFNRVIAESGSIALTYSREECYRLTEMLLQETNSSTMQDLINLSEEELKKANEKLNDYNNFPERDGIILPVDLYKSYGNGEGAHIDLLIGTNADETRYWMNEMGYYVPKISGSFIYERGMHIMFESDIKPFSSEDKKSLKQFMQSLDDKRIWKITEFYNEILFRLPALYQVEMNARSNGLAYIYYWNYPSAIKNIGACHAVELAYVFNNLDETIYTGNNIDPNLAKTVQQMWVNFAKTGNPSIEGLSWPAYASSEGSMILDSTCHYEENWLKERKTILEPLLKYGLNGCYTRLKFNVPCVIQNIVFFICVIILILCLIIKLL